MRALIAAEVVKLRSTRLVWGLFAASELIVVIGILGVLVQGADLTDPQTTQEALTHVSLVSLFALVLGAYAVAGEYRFRTITDTYLGEPDRRRVLLAKLAVTSGAGLLLGAAAAATAILAASIAFATKGASVDLSDAAVWRTLAGAVAWTATFAGIGVGLGALIRNLTAAVVAALAWLAVVEGVVASVMGDLARWLPYRTGAALGNTAGTDNALSQQTAAVVMVGYVVLFAGLGLWATRRDVA